MRLDRTRTAGAKRTPQSLWTHLNGHHSPPDRILGNRPKRQGSPFGQKDCTVQPKRTGVTHHSLVPIKIYLVIKILLLVYSKILIGRCSGKTANNNTTTR